MMLSLLAEGHMACGGQSESRPASKILAGYEVAAPASPALPALLKGRRDPIPRSSEGRQGTDSRPSLTRPPPRSVEKQAIASALVNAMHARHNPERCSRELKYAW